MPSGRSCFLEAPPLALWNWTTAYPVLAGTCLQSYLKKGKEVPRLHLPLLSCHRGLWPPHWRRKQQKCVFTGAVRFWASSVVQENSGGLLGNRGSGRPAAPSSVISKPVSLTQSRAAQLSGSFRSRRGAHFLENGTGLVGDGFVSVPVASVSLRDT